MAYIVQSQNPSRRKVTQEQLRELFTLDPDEGVLRYRVKHLRYKAGLVAGSVGHKGWRSIMVNQRRYQAHHLVWMYVHGRWPTHELDHVNGIRDDNRLSNLREADAFQQVMNSARPPTNKSGARNVYFIRKSGKFRVSVRYRGKHVHIGHFSTLQEASVAATDARNRLHGEFATSRCCLSKGC